MQPGIKMTFYIDLQLIYHKKYTLHPPPTKLHLHAKLQIPAFCSSAAMYQEK